MILRFARDGWVDDYEEELVVDGVVYVLVRYGHRIGYESDDGGAISVDDSGTNTQYLYHPEFYAAGKMQNSTWVVDVLQPGTDEWEFEDLPTGTDIHDYLPTQVINRAIELGAFQPGWWGGDPALEETP